MPAFPITSLNQVHRLAKRAVYDSETIYPIIDAAPICHVGFLDEGQAFVLPTIHARLGDSIILHGAPANRLLKLAGAAQRLCLTFTLLDGLVLARSVFHSSMNYRSAVVFGRGRAIEDRAEKRRVLTAIVEHVMPGRTADARPPSETELNGTSVLAIDIESASAKIRTGGPIDDEDDYGLSVWAGVVPVYQAAADPVGDPRMPDATAIPDYIGSYRKSHAKEG